MDAGIQSFGFSAVRSLTDVFGLVAIGIAGALALMLVNKIEQLRRMRATLDRLERSFNDLDEQAKLIIKTDLELNKTQEELDKRLAGLNALQRISRLVSTTLDADEVFRRLDKALTTELGFEKTIVFTIDDEKQLSCRIKSGFPDEAIEHILAGFAKDRSLAALMREGRILSSLSLPKQKKERIQELFDLEQFIITPILSQDGIIGIVFVGNESDKAPITEGAEELMSVLSNQIGQSLENAQLFEKVYHARQELESKIQDRTKELASALDQVQKISKAKSEFVSAVSHELRTPLTSVKGYASILISGKVGEVPDGVKERLEKINKHSDNLVQLINDLLDISRIESGRVEMKFERHALADIIENARDILAPQMKTKNISFAAEVAADVPGVVVDHTHIERIFINLISNAVKFTPEGGTIRVSATLEKGTRVLVNVSDTGIGIPQEEIPKLFHEFYRIDNEVNQNVKGTGLGLVLIKNIIEAHRGTIWVTSAVNKGTTFHFTLPIVEEREA